MARPKKAEDAKRDRRLTFYMTDEEETRLNTVAAHMGLDKTKVIAKALDRWIQTLENPPEVLKQAKYEKIMELGREEGEGYICSRGDLFWLESTWPSPPLCCPACGDRLIKRTWFGRITKGF